jgi:hypothetical protein
VLDPHLGPSHLGQDGGRGGGAADSGCRVDRSMDRDVCVDGRGRGSVARSRNRRARTSSVMVMVNSLLRKVCMPKRRARGMTSFLRGASVLVGLARDVG